MGSGSSSQAPAIRKAVEVPNLKIAVVGDPQVGKTSILTRYIHNQYSPIYVQTHKAAIDNAVRKLNVPGHAKVPVTLWDIPGQEDLPLHTSYFTDLDAVIVVVDLSDPASLDSATIWRQTVLATASFTGSEAETKGEKRVHEESTDGQTRIDHSQNIEDIPFLLLGNKLDLCTARHADGDDITASVELTEKSDSEKEKGEENLLISDRVRQLEEISASGFVGSVAVSAHNNDLSVHAAIQAFLRHILEKRSLVQRRWVAPPDPPLQDKPTGRPRYTQERQLRPVGITEIDDKFNQAEDILYRVTSLQRYQQDSLRKFACQCVETGVLASTQDASMQNCLVALRDRLADLDLKLQLKLDEEFLHLEVKASKEDAKLDKDLRYAIKTFNKEYAAVTKAMLAEFPVAQTKLGQIEASVDHLCTQFQGQLPPQTQAGRPAERTAGPADKGGGQERSAAAGDSALVSVPASTSSHGEDRVAESGGSQQGKLDQVEAGAGGARGAGSGLEGSAGGTRLGAVVERNRAILRHAAHECHDCLAHMQRSVKQAKAAFVW